MGASAGLLHSEFVARDMDELRKALGADQISYYGASYGSTLGVWYATLFGERVRAMVVDGADNPVDDTSTQEARIANVLDETAQFEVLLGDALDACDTPVCPIHNDGDPRGYFAANAHRLEAVAEAAGGNPLAGALGVITTLYAEQLWPALWQGLAELVERDDPTILAQLAAVQLGEDGGGITFTQHVNCLDSWSLDPQLDREIRLGDEAAMTAAFEERFPLLSLMEIQPARHLPVLRRVRTPAARAAPQRRGSADPRDRQPDRSGHAVQRVPGASGRHPRRRPPAGGRPPRPRGLSRQRLRSRSRPRRAHRPATPRRSGRNLPFQLGTDPKLT